MSDISDLLELLEKPRDYKPVGEKHPDKYERVGVYRQAA